MPFSYKQSNGFTLVELAIVLMIIGLLIGAILKGQELIQNARLKITMQQLKSFDAAAITFHDAYGALPGDMLSPQTRLPNCTTTPCSTAGNNNGLIDPTNGTTPNRGPTINAEATVSSERNNFWIHMVKAGLLNGDPTPATSNWRTILPQTPFKNGGIALWGYTGINGYAILGENLTNGGLPTLMAAALDGKMDDGKPLTGQIITLTNGVSVLTTCRTGSSPTANYTSGGTCDVFVKGSFN
jgi:prepilin-type N-terminal cleavage/methylation domain-containing protein